jgi:thioredoxin 1
VALVALVSVSAGGAVREVRSKAEFDKIIAHNALTGMPVVVDFFSDSCGPCRKIAPVYVQIANQNKKDAVFLKVNVQMANVGVEIRSMPTFQFYAKGKKVHEFSGADEGGIRRSVGQLVSKSKKGKKVLEVTSKAQFKKILRDAGKLPVVAGFFSKADDDCKKIYPKFKELAKEYHRKTVFIKVDVDTVAEIKEVANVDTVPTFHVYKGGKKLQEVTGADEQGLHKAVNDEAESGGGACFISSSHISLSQTQSHILISLAKLTCETPNSLQTMMKTKTKVVAAAARRRPGSPSAPRRSLGGRSPTCARR